MGPDVAFHLQIAAVVAVALLIVAVAVLASGGGAYEGAGSDEAAAGDVESALGGVTLMTYEQAASGKKNEEAGERCAICLSEYGEAGELVRVVPACGHFFHAECGVEAWLRAHRTCPLCRGELWPPPPPRMTRPLPLPRRTRPECPPMPPRSTSR